MFLESDIRDITYNFFIYQSFYNKRRSMKCGAYWRAGLIGGRRLKEGGAYWRKYGTGISCLAIDLIYFHNFKPNIVISFYTYLFRGWNFFDSIFNLKLFFFDININIKSFFILNFFLIFCRRNFVPKILQICSWLEK